MDNGKPIGHQQIYQHLFFMEKVLTGSIANLNGNSDSLTEEKVSSVVTNEYN